MHIVLREKHPGALRNGFQSVNDPTLGGTFKTLRPSSLKHEAKRPLLDPRNKAAVMLRAS